MKVLIQKMMYNIDFVNAVKGRTPFPRSCLLPSAASRFSQFPVRRTSRIDQLALIGEMLDCAGSLAVKTRPSSAARMSLRIPGFMAFPSCAFLFSAVRADYWRFATGAIRVP